jgi:hypothetical protein
MTRMPSAGLWSVALLLGLSALGCTPGGVGDPCTPEDEYQQNFNGFQVTETNAESRSFQCETRLCLVNHFQGRVSCRLGQPAQVDASGNPVADYNPKCSIPGTKAVTPASADVNNNNIKVQVPAQLVDRQTEKAVYCSCRCDGPEKNAKYCECPEGFECSPVVPNLRITAGSGQLAGSYCIRTGSAYDAARPPKSDTCASDPKACGCDGDNPPDECGAK